MKFLAPTVLIAVHIAACIWYFLARITDFDVNTWVVRYNFEDSGQFHQYLAAFYWIFTTMVTVGYGDIAAGPGTPLSKWRP